MRFAVLSIAVFAAFCLGLPSRGKEETKPLINGPSADTLRRIATSEEKERLEILRELSKNQADLEARLIKELHAATEKDKKFAFVYLMGRYRLEGTAWVLANIIDLESPESWHDALPLWSRYPAVDALTKIGRRSISPMLANIKAAKGEKITELSIKVIQYIETPAIARIIIQKAIDKEDDPTKKTKLQNSLKYIKEE